MNERSYDAAAALVPKTYVAQGRDARKGHEKQIHLLMQQRKLPDEGWSNLRIQLLLQELALMDSNNFPENVGVGEREGRIASELVAQRHFRLGHGVGRSGDVAAVQPKAAGSSLLARLTNSMLLDLIRRSGVPRVQHCVLIPVATGMAMLLTLLTLKQNRPVARYVVWPRIDQKSCFKCILSAGLEPVVVENVLEGEELRTNVAAIEEQIIKLGAENIACVLTTTSCFAPRTIDKLPDVAQVCKRYDIPHITNNAYGVQSTKCMHFIQEAHRVGRLDAFVQSTDKNFMVPVGGAIVAGFEKTFICGVAQMYPGRASATPAIDVFVTLLTLGEKGYRRLCGERKELYSYLKEKMGEVAAKHGERLLHTPNNPISVGMSLDSLSAEQVDWKELGSMLFVKCVSGTRVVVPHTEKTIGPHTFTNWGAHYDGYPCAYLTAAAAIGMKRDEVDLFAKRLDKTLGKFKRKCAAKLSNSLRSPIEESAGGREENPMAQDQCPSSPPKVEEGDEREGEDSH